MSNNLIRAGSFSITPAQPGRPYQPAYTVVESYTVTQIEFTQDVTWVRAFTFGDGNVGDGYVSQGFETWFPIPRGTDTLFYLSDKTVSVRRTIPAQEAIPARPEQRIFYPPEGWTAFARSVRSVGNAIARFKIADRSTVAIGLARFSQPVSGYGHIPRGLLFTGSSVRNLRTNENLGTYSSEDTFDLRREGRTLTLMQGEDVLATEELPFGAEEPLFLSAALYGYQNAVLDPEFIDISQNGTSAAVFPALRGRTFEGTYDSSEAVLLGITASSGILQRSVADLGRMYAASSSKPYASSFARLTGLSAASYAGSWAVERPNESQAVLNPMVGASNMLNGGLGTGGATLVGVAALSSDRPLGLSRALLTSMTARSWDASVGRGSVTTVFGIDAGLSSVAVFDTRVLPEFGIDFDLSATDAADEVVEFTAGFSVAMSTSTEEVVDARSIFWFEVPIDVPGAFVDTWVANASTGGSTRYENYPFESLANIGGYYVGVSDAGIFELSGDSDDGEPISARIDFGLKRFGSDRLKRLEQIYLGIKSDGQMYVKVSAEGVSYTYPMRDFSPELQIQRVTPGKGMRANYFGFELGNTAGSDFEFSSISTLVAETARRI